MCQKLQMIKDLCMQISKQLLAVEIKICIFSHNTVIYICMRVSLIFTTSIRTRSSGQCVSGAICSAVESSPSSASPLFQMTKPPWMLRQALPEPSLKAEEYKINSIRSLWKSWYKCLHNLHCYQCMWWQQII